MHKRVSVMSLTAVCGAAAIIVATLAPASGDEGSTVHFQVSSPVNSGNFASSFTVVGGNCPVGPVVSPCNSVAQGAEPSPGAYNDTLTGDVQGTGVHATEVILSTTNFLTFVPLALDVPYVIREVVSPATVEGCGTGTYVTQNEGNLNSGTGTWKIVPGSGTGDLVGITGGGTDSGQNPPPLVGNSVATYVGHISGCKKMHEE